MSEVHIWSRLRAALAIAAAVTLGMGALVSAPPASSHDAVTPTTVLIVGDSITHGSTGDYTWRYFVARELAKTSRPIDFVGPRSGLYDGQDRPDSMSYVDPAFDTDHAAVWGNALAWPRLQWSELARYRPDVVVFFLGFNDMTIFRQTPDEVVSKLEAALATLRASNPEAKVVVVPPPPTGASVIPPLNARLATWAAGQAPSGVTLAAEVPDYALGAPGAPADTWDGLHPDTSGQVKFAAVVTDALAKIGLASPYPRPLTVPAEGLRTAAVLAADPVQGQVQLRWRNPPGATATDIWIRDVGVGSAWTVFARAVTGETWRSVDLRAGHTYEFRVQSIKGWVPAEDLYSNVIRMGPVSATPTPNPTIAPASATAAPIAPTSAAAPPPSTAPLQKPAGQGAVPVESPTPAATMPGLPIRVPAAASLGLNPGPETGSPSSLPGLAEALPQVQGVSLRCRARSCQATWASVPGATGYQVAFRVGDGSWSTGEVEAATSWVRRMRPSRLWARVRPWSGRISGPWSRVQRWREASRGGLRVS